MAVKTRTGEDWDEFARLNATWAVLSDPGKKYQAWEEKDFFAIGESRIGEIMDLIALEGRGSDLGRALDFGCGIGRLTKALAGRFRQVKGVDISPEMIRRAKINLRDYSNVELSVISAEWRPEENESFDLIISDLTLQHLPDRRALRYYLRLFRRLLKPGGVLFFRLPSVPGYSFFKTAIMELRGRLYYFFIFLGVPREFCFKKLRLSPRMAMQYLPAPALREIFGEEYVFRIYNDHSLNTDYLIRRP